MLRGISISFLIGLSVFIIASLALSQAQAILLAVIALMLVLWTNEALPLGVVSLFPIVLFPSLSLSATADVSANYAKPIIFLFIGGFMLALAVEKTNFHKLIAYKLLKLFPHTVRGILFSLLLISGILSSFISNSTSALLLIPLALSLSSEREIQKRFALAIAYGASIGGILTPIGTPPNLILYGIFDELHIVAIPFIKWILLVFPLALLMFLVVGWILSRSTEDYQIKANELIDTVSFEHKKLIACFILLFFILIFNSPIQGISNGLGLNEKVLMLAFGLLMFMPPMNLLEWKDMQKLPYEIIFLFGAGFSIAMAFRTTGLASELANSLLRLTHLHPFVLILLIASLVTFTTEITSNTALIAMILPVLYEVCQQSQLNARLFMMIATICASYAFMLPIATPPNAIAMSSGAVSVKSMAKYGFMLNLIGILLISLISYFIWSHFLL